jgi:hypothetical protein
LATALAGSLALFFAPAALGGPIPAQEQETGNAAIPYLVVLSNQKVSTRATDLALDKPERPLSLLAAGELIGTDPQPPQTETPADTEEKEDEEIIRATVNPITERISLPITSRTAFGIGPFERTATAVNISLVLPIPLGENYVVLRPSLPFIFAPTITQPQGETFSLGDLRMQAYFVPKPTGGLTWGFGPTLLFPTASTNRLGFGKWGIGPVLAAVWTEGRWTVGGRIENYWSVAGDGGRPDISQFTLQAGVTYLFDQGWYFTSTPTITAFWNPTGTGDQWTVPIGGGFGKVFQLSTLPLSISIQAFWQPIRPVNADGGWTLLISFQSLFPRFQQP